MKTTSTSAKSAQPKIELLPPSITLRVGRRRLTLSWRSRPRLPSLLSSLLRRSWRRVLAPALKLSIAAAAVSGAWQSQALADAPVLPTGWKVVNGDLTFTLNGNVLHIDQTSLNAIAKFKSFSIGEGAIVDITQPGAAAAFLAKVTGSDISQIYGTLKAPGTVILFNPNGVMVGATGVVDVGRFVATTLKISDDDFLAGKMTFAKGRRPAGSVENYGNITSASGGSVYLIGSSVTNGGIIKSPQGEVILAAGQSVTLADTGTPGVTVNVTGSAGNVTNLGTITAEAGRIGIAAGLITNGGNISASSVVREGGRVFLRASSNLTTTANSSITADGTTGGNITLYSDEKAYIGGDVSATGSAGRGGYVETSGLKQLDVVKAPKVGVGGTWYIDPYDLEVVADDNIFTNVSNVVNVITSLGSLAQISNATINAQLNSGVNVTLATGVGGQIDGGNITINSAINKTGTQSATLTLNADRNILIKAPVTSSNSSLSLTLHSNYNGVGDPGTVTIDNTRVELNGGTMNVLDGMGAKAADQGTLILSNGSVTLGDGGKLYSSNVTVGMASYLNVSTSAEVHGVNLDLTNGGQLNMDSGSSLSVSNLNVSSNSSVSATGASLFNVQNALNNSGDVTLDAVANATVGTFNNGNSDTSANFKISNTTLTVNTAFENRNAMDVGGNTNIILNGDMTNYGDVNLGTLDSQVAGTTKISGNGTVYNYHNITVGGFVSEGPENSESGLGHTLNMTNAGGLQMGDSSNLYIKNELGVANIKDLNGGAGSYVAVTGGTLNVSNSTTISGYFDVDNTGNATLSGTTSFASGADVHVYDGKLTASNTTIDGQLSVSGGSATLNGNTSLTSDIETFGQISVSGGTLNVSGNTTLAGRTNVTGGAATFGGNTTIDGTMNVSGGAATFSGNTTIDGTMNVSGGSATLNGNTSLTSDIETFGQISVSGGTLNVSGNTTLAGRTNVTGGTATFGGNTTIDGTMNVSGGAVTLGGTTKGGGTLKISYRPQDDDSFVQTDSNPSVATAVTLGNATSNLSVVLDGGSLTLNGSSRIANMTVSDGTVTGQDGSRLVVANSFSQNGGTLTLADASITQASGTLSVGNITAANLVLQANSGDIRQNSNSDLNTYTSLHVTKQLIARASGNINLGNSGSNNQIAAFAANSTGMGDITLLNHLNTTDTSAVTINGVNANNGNITIENYGAMQTAAIGSKAAFLDSMPKSGDDAAITLASLGINSTGQAKTSNGSVSLTTHSPLTIGSGGISATTGVSLTAGTVGDSSSSLITNGVISTTSGNVNLSGNTVAINANVNAGSGSLNLPSGVTPTYAAGVAITTSTGTTIPVPASSGSTTTSNSGSSTANQQAAQQQQNQQSQNLKNSTDSASVSSETSGTNAVQQASNSNQTTGGTSGSFGDEGDGKKQDGKKPLPMCT